MGLSLDGKSRSSDLVFICHLYIIICCRHWNEVLRGLAGTTLACYPEDGGSYPQDGWFFFLLLFLSPLLSPLQRTDFEYVCIETSLEQKNMRGGGGGYVVTVSVPIYRFGESIHASVAVWH